MENDEYKTLKVRSTGIFRDRGSKFIAIASPAGSVDEAMNIIDDIKKEYRDARHHCYAYKIGKDEERWRVNDDGEPAGSAGKPIMGQIRSFDITNIVIVVVRYFGGTLLGVGGLINAYKSAAKEALSSGQLVIKTLKVQYLLEFPYSGMNSVMKLIKEKKLEQYYQQFELDCKIKVRFRKDFEEKVLKALASIKDVEYTISD
ncbi:MAG: YigZ family protein [Bacteroidales bacterium]|nr:YigZ family protein [Bacteroidales bacterium]